MNVYIASDYEGAKRRQVVLSIYRSLRNCLLTWYKHGCYITKEQCILNGTNRFMHRGAQALMGRVSIITESIILVGSNNHNAPVADKADVVHVWLYLLLSSLGEFRKSINNTFLVSLTVLLIL